MLFGTIPWGVSLLFSLRHVKRCDHKSFLWFADLSADKVSKGTTGQLTSTIVRKITTFLVAIIQLAGRIVKEIRICLVEHTRSGIQNKCFGLILKTGRPFRVYLLRLRLFLLLCLLVMLWAIPTKLIGSTFIGRYRTRPTAALFLMQINRAGMDSTTAIAREIVGMIPNRTLLLYHPKYKNIYK